MLIPNLRYWRLRRALTQEELAEKANVGARSVAGYEAGAGARPGSVRKLAEALDVDVSALMAEEYAPKAEGSSPADSLEERNLFVRVRPLVMLLEEQASKWQRELNEGVTEDVYEKALVKREDVMETLEDLLESLTEEDGLQWDNARHRPSRRVQRALEVAFIQWSRTWSAVADAYDAGDEQTTMGVSRWFKEAS